MFYVLAGFSCSYTKDVRFITTRHKRAANLKGFPKTSVCSVSLEYKDQLFFYSEKYIRHAFQVFRKSSPVGLTMLQGTFYVHQGTHSYRPKIPLTSWILPVEFIIFTQVCFARVLKPARFQNVLFSKRVLNSEHLEWKTAEEISTEI